MILTKFTAQNVHGYLNYEIDFFEQLTFLVGINGSGKTSVLKLILGLISPSYTYLSQVEFERVSVELKKKDDKYTITANHDKKSKSFSILLDINGKNISSGLFHSNFINQNDNFEYEKISLIEKQQTLIFEEDKVINKVRELCSIYFLGLDRKINNGKTIDDRITRFYPTKENNIRKAVSIQNGQNHLDNSLYDVQSMLFQYARRISRIQPRQNEILKNEILKSIFKYNEEIDINDLINYNEEDLIIKRENVIKTLENFQMIDIFKNVESFFDEMLNVIREFKNNERHSTSNDLEIKEIEEKQFKLISKWIINNSQLSIINNIIRLSEQAQKNKQKLYEPIEKFQSIITDFFNEGNKKIIIDEVGEIKVITSKNNNRTSIYQLSSGEKQVIIMIANLIFDKEFNSRGLFIIDEPEISLHLAWQEIFVDAIIKANPKMQFILATHSPSIVSNIENEKYCQDINRIN